MRDDQAVADADRVGRRVIRTAPRPDSQTKWTMSGLWTCTFVGTITENVQRIPSA